ncbi:DHH family phosphoesterase [Deinococcus sedimenti]|uniref:Phosphoesterase n=1 Tax=Deinococcus sedimenti TaxID=1867090 RepID=A0ABQ2S322_9DEIO|nr:bifunctional oligoribonuclease/PAP phosphatase NrnA [Deinococcus sedimenti]GGR83449.1 phosphoesterase [Deinococcus sedimenti]
MTDTAPVHSDLQAVARALLDHTGPIVVLSHENPDGDALGSVLGLTRALRQLGREVIAPMHVPRFLTFVPRDGELSPALTEWPAGAMAAVLDVDNNDHARVAGADLSTFTGPVVNVDHHGTNQRRADALAVDPAQPAAATMIAELVDLLGAKWSEDLATPLMLGLITDTGSFRFDSVTPAAFQTASKLRSAGARLGWINDHLGQNPHTYYTLLREVLGTLQFMHEGRVVLVRVDGDMLDRTGSVWEDVENYVGMFRNVEGSQLAVMVKDFGDRVKISMRSRAGLSAQNIAVALGGGGHVPAAGASLNEPWAQVQPQLDAAIAAELARADQLSS